LKINLTLIRDDGVLSTLYAFASNKKSGYERESAGIAFQSFAAVLGPSVAPPLLPSLSILFELYMDKGDVVRSAASSAVKSILKLYPPEATRVVFAELVKILENGKWKTKVGVLDALKSFVASKKDAVAEELVRVLPKVEHAMHDTKPEVWIYFDQFTVLTLTL
jgi:elongation factor 3